MGQKYPALTKSTAFFMTVLFIISWVAVLVFSMRYVVVRGSYASLKAKYEDMKEAFNVVARRLDYLEAQTARLAGENTARRESKAAEFLQWRYLLQEEVAQANNNFLAKIDKLLAAKPDAELLNLLYYNLGLGNTLAANFDLALEAFEKAVKYDVRDADSYYCLGLLYSAYKKDNKKAINAYKNYLAFAPSASKADEVRQRIKALEK